MPQVKVKIDAVRRPGLENLKNQAVLILKKEGEERFLPIWVSSAQADILAAELQGIPMGQRTAPGLFLESVNVTCSDILCVTIHFDKNIFYAKVLTYPNDEPLDVRCPICVALSLAYRTHVPILVNSEIMDKCLITTPWDEPSSDIDSEVQSLNRIAKEVGVIV